MSLATRLVGLGALLCVLAGAFAVSSLYVAGLVPVLLVLAAEASVRLAARRARVHLELGAETVIEGNAARAVVWADGWPRLCGRPELRAAPRGPWRELAARGERLELKVTPARRGEFVVGPASVRFTDPFGICAREHRSPEARLLVLPLVERVRREDLDRVSGLGRSAPRHDGGSGVGGLRAYRTGAPASRIHWLSVARRGVLLERRFEEDAEEAAITVALDTGSAESQQALDMAVRAAASLCVGLAAAGGCALLLPGWGAAHPLRADLSSWPALHARLALAAEGRELDWRALARSRLVVLVGARRSWREGPRAVPEGVSCTVSPAPRDAPVLFTVAGCAVQAAGRRQERAA